MSGAIPMPAMNHYYDYEEVRACLESFHRAAPGLCRLRSLGKTHRDREILLLEVSAFSEGSCTGKKGVYVDACTHAEEICGTNTALYLAWFLLSQYGLRENIRALLRGTVFYILPRLNPDGVEYCLKLNQPGNGNGRYLPEEFQPGGGLHFTDINHDGKIAQMRVPDPDGEWKISKKDSRLMALRTPDDTTGPFYRMYPEGTIEGDPAGFCIHPSRSGNLNRNYPGKWKPEGLQYGGGVLPMEEPETRAVAEFFVSHPHIAAVVSLHTNAGAIMRPFFSQGDAQYAGRDLELFEALGKMGEEELGYKVLSFFEHMTPDKSKARTGALCDWTFDFMGIPSFLIEFWNMYDAAGTARKLSFRRHQRANGLRCAALGGPGSRPRRLPGLDSLPAPAAGRCGNRRPQPHLGGAQPARLPPAGFIRQRQQFHHQARTNSAAACYTAGCRRAARAGYLQGFRPHPECRLPAHKPDRPGAGQQRRTPARAALGAAGRAHGAALLQLPRRHPPPRGALWPGRRVVA